MRTFPSSRSSRERSFEASRDALTLEEADEESRMVMEALRMVPSGLRILLRISENSWGTSVDCQVSSWRVLMTSLSRVFCMLSELHCGRHWYNRQWGPVGVSWGSWYWWLCGGYQWRCRKARWWMVVRLDEISVWNWEANVLRGRNRRSVANTWGLRSTESIEEHWCFEYSSMITNIWSSLRWSWICWAASSTTLRKCFWTSCAFPASLSTTVLFISAAPSPLRTLKWGSPGTPRSEW